MLRWRHTTRRKYSACSQRREARAGFAGSTAVLTGREPSSREMENDETILACHGYEGRQESALARRFPHLVRPLLALPSRRLEPVAPREMPLAMSFECDGDHKMNDFATPLNGSQVGAQGRPITVSAWGPRDDGDPDA